MVRALNRGIPESHDAIANETVNGSALFRYRAGDLLEIGRDLDQKIIGGETLGVAGEILQIGKEHREESRLNAQAQRDTRFDELADYVEWNKGGERLQRGPQQRSRGFELRNLSNFRWLTLRRVKMQAFDFLQLPRHVFDRP